MEENELRAASAIKKWFKASKTWPRKSNEEIDYEWESQLLSNASNKNPQSVVTRGFYQTARKRLRKEDTLEKDEAAEIIQGTLVLLEPTGLQHKWFSIGVEGPKGAQSLSRDGAFANKLVDRNVGDKIDFGNGFKVLEIKKYLSN